MLAQRKVFFKEMALTINTNMSSIIAQANLNSATNALNSSIERMTTGYKIYHAKDNAAAYSITNNLSSQISSMYVVQDNTLNGIDLLELAEDGLEQIIGLLKKLRIIL